MAPNQIRDGVIVSSCFLNVLPLLPSFLANLFAYVSVKFLEFVKPFCKVLPEIQKPERKVRFLILNVC